MIWWPGPSKNGTLESEFMVLQKVSVGYTEGIRVTEGKKPAMTETKDVSPECRWYSRHAGPPVWQGKEGGRLLLYCTPVARIKTKIIFLNFSINNNISCAQLAKL